jgi:mono/diheme cytochrome c family protein
MKTTIKLSLAGLALAFTAAAGHAATAADNWDNNCAACHGADGKGQTKQGKKLKLQDYTDAKVQAGMKDEDMVKAILEGVKDKDSGKERMKSFKDDLSADEAKDLVAYIRKFKA